MLLYSFVYISPLCHPTLSPTFAPPPKKEKKKKEL